MKYLKRFNENNQNIEEIKRNILDIFLDLTDDDQFNIEFESYWVLTPSGGTFGKHGLGKLRIKKNGPYCNGLGYGSKRFDYIEIEEYIERLKDYMSDIGYDVLIGKERIVGDTSDVGLFSVLVTFKKII